LRSRNGPRVLEVNSSPGLEGIEKASGRNLTALLFAEIERRTAAFRTQGSIRPN
jgi:ribosomal protein S6--L-glutamate ligase